MCLERTSNKMGADQISQLGSKSSNSKSPWSKALSDFGFESNYKSVKVFILFSFKGKSE